MLPLRWPEFTQEDLEKDHLAEMDRLIRQMEEREAEDLNDEVYCGI